MYLWFLFNVRTQQHFYEYLMQGLLRGLNPPMVMPDVCILIQIHSDAHKSGSADIPSATSKHAALDSATGSVRSNRIPSFFGSNAHRVFNVSLKSEAGRAATKDNCIFNID